MKRSKYLPEGGAVPAEEMDALADHLRAVVQFARNCGQIKRDDDAKKLWAEVYPRLSEGYPGLVGAATSRAEAQVLRLSAIYAVLDMSPTIRVEHLQAALAVWDYAFASARYIFGDATGDPIADRIRNALTVDGLSRTQIRDLLGRHAPAERVQGALNTLLRLGIAERRTVMTEGRPIEMWFATKATKG